MGEQIIFTVGGGLCGTPASSVVGVRITRPGRLLCAIEGLSVDFALIGLEVGFERSPLVRLTRDLAEPAEPVFGVMPVVSEDDPLS